MPPFEREPEPLSPSHRTTARGLFLTLLLGLGAGSAAAFPPEQPPPPAGSTQSPKYVFPVLGSTRYFDDFGAPRHQGPHEGIDLMSTRKAIALAVESGKVEYNSGGWGCMLYLHGDSGTKYAYVHLNNDLTARNDNGGRCVPGVAFAHGLKSGQRVEIGQHIAFVGDSGDADGGQPHLHFERHPAGRGPTNPFRWLNKLPRLLFTAPVGTQVSVALRGTVIEVAPPSTLRLKLEYVKPWPSGTRVMHKGRPFSISVPSTATFESMRGYSAVPNLAQLQKGRPVLVWTEPTASTLAAHLGRSLVAERVQLLPAPQKKP